MRIPRSASSVTLNGIPAAEFAQFFGDEMVGGAAERDGQTGAVEAGQDHIKPVGIFAGEPAREQVLVAVVIIKFGLHADQVIAAFLKGEDRPFSSWSISGLSSASKMTRYFPRALMSP